MVKFATIIIYTVSVIAIAFGGMYLLKSDIMPYHYAFLELNHNELINLNNKLTPLFLALMKVSGAAFIAVGIAGIINTRILYINKSKRAWWSLLLMFVLSLVPMLYVTLNIANAIKDGEPKPPWYLTLIMLVMLLSALIMTYKYVNNKKTS